MLVVCQVQLVVAQIVAGLGVQPHRPEVGMREDPRAVVVPQPVDAAEVVGVAVCHHSCVDVLEAGTDLGEAVSQGLP